MKLFKKLFTATLIFFIVLSIAGIVYVLIQEETPEIKETKKETKQATKPIEKKTVGEKSDKSNSLSVKPNSSREVAIIIDDIGYDINAAKSLLKIDADFTFAILPFQTHSREAAEMFHKAKKEMILHLPMEPISYPREKPGEGALFTEMSDEEIVLQLKDDVAAVPYVSGVNNHMGSKFMMDEQKLSLIFKELKKGNMFFVDSRTSADTKTFPAAKKTGLTVAQRKIFIDNNRNYNEIYNNLINIAKSDDISPMIIIGHPYPETIQALKDTTKILREKGVSIVSLSQIMKKEKATH
jgi:uncharacterized protein